MTRVCKTRQYTAALLIRRAVSLFNPVSTLSCHSCGFLAAVIQPSWSAPNAFSYLQDMAANLSNAPLACPCPCSRQVAKQVLRQMSRFHALHEPLERTNIFVLSPSLQRFPHTPLSTACLDWTIYYHCDCASAVRYSDVGVRDGPSAPACRVSWGTRRNAPHERSFHCEHPYFESEVPGR